jgi:hypothetical protein
MSVYRPVRTFGGVLLLTILGAGCNDDSDKSSAPAVQAAQPATRSATEGTENARPREQIAKQVATGTEDDHPREIAKQDAAAANQDAGQATPERPVIYSALELAKIIDFTTLPVPEGATRADRTLSSKLQMMVQATVTEAVSFYLDELSAMGWKADGNKTNVSEGFVFLTKDGHVVSLSVFPTDEKKPECRVNMTFCGNLDTRTLPRSDGSKLLHGSQTHTIYTTPYEVVAEAEWISKTLSAQGWQRYIRAKASKSKSDKLRMFNLRKQGYTLSVFVSTAPAEGNQTSVQYGVSALGHELPAPDDAVGVEFDDTAWTLDCELPRPMEAGVDFYRQAMPAAGYKALRGEQPQATYVNLRFGTEAGDVVNVQVAKKDDKTSKISIFGISAATMEKLRKEEEKRTKAAR